MELKSAPSVTILKTRVHMSYQHQHLSLIDEGWHSILEICNVTVYIQLTEPVLNSAVKLTNELRLPFHETVESDLANGRVVKFHCQLRLAWSHFWQSFYTHCDYEAWWSADQALHHYVNGLRTLNFNRFRGERTEVFQIAEKCLQKGLLSSRNFRPRIWPGEKLIR